jgi:hypothetical protein
LLVGRVLEACSIDLGGKRRVDEDDEDEGEAAFLQHHAATAGLNSTEIEELQVLIVRIVFSMSNRTLCLAIVYGNVISLAAFSPQNGSRGS